MKEEINISPEGENKNFDNKKITRKEAIKKTGLLAASTATMMILLKSQKAQACSPTTHHNKSNNKQNQNQNQNHRQNQRRSRNKR